jgi:hypothetical protein
MRKACLEIDASSKKAKLLRCECTARGTKEDYFIKRYSARLYRTMKHQFDGHFLIRSESIILYHVEFFFGHLDRESVIGKTNVIRKGYIGGRVIEIMCHMHQKRATRL